MALSKEDGRSSAPIELFVPGVRWSGGNGSRCSWAKCLLDVVETVCLCKLSSESSHSCGFEGSEAILCLEEGEGVSSCFNHLVVGIMES